MRKLCRMVAGNRVSVERPFLLLEVDGFVLWCENTVAFKNVS